MPCNDFKGWMGECGFDNTAWVKRFAAEARPGPYLRVIEEGEVVAGDRAEVVHRPGHGVTVSMMFRALMTERGCCRGCSRSTAWSRRPGLLPSGTSPATGNGSAVRCVVVLPPRNPVI